MVTTKWIVLTGTTSSGKSTLCDYLHKRGFPVVKDLTRVYINILFEEGFTVEQIRNDKSKFFNRVHELRLWWQGKLKNYTDEPIVFDRAAPENIAYARVDGFDENTFWETTKKYRYNTIFMPKPLAFKPDGMRTNNPERRLKVFDEIKDVYTHLGYNIIEIPVLPIDKREVFIEKHLEVMEITPTSMSSEASSFINDVMQKYKAKIRTEGLVI